MGGSDRRGQDGQVLVLFAVAALALIAMVGLVLDGGATFAQRRTQQNGADLSALAGANAWLLEAGDEAAKTAAAVALAKAVASENGYTDGSDQVVVTVSTAVYGAGRTVTVSINAKHHNAFGSIVAMPTWDVSVTATSVVGPGGNPRGVAPFLFRNDAFVNGTGEVQPPYGNPANPFSFGEANGDVPVSPNDIAWTVFASPANLNTNAVRQIINGSDQLSRPLTLGEYIGQHNNGNHTALFNDVDQYLAGKDLVAPIVDAAGGFQGWAMFHVVSAAGGSSKTITGYFTSGFAENLDVCMDVATCPISYGGVKVLKLIN